MAVTNDSGRCLASTCFKNAIFGCVVVTTTSAKSSSPSSRTTPVARPEWIVIPAHVRLRAHEHAVGLRRFRMAVVTLPMPPSGNPHDPMGPSPTLPMLWCAITYAVPGDRGPAHVPMTPLTDKTPLRASDSKWSSRRSAMLIDISSRQVRDQACVERPKLPGEAELLHHVTQNVRSDVRRDCAEQRAEDAPELPQPGVPLDHGVGVAPRKLGDFGVPCGAVRMHLEVAPIAARYEIPVLRVDLVPVPLELELLQDCRRHQAYDVGERGDLCKSGPHGVSGSLLRPTFARRSRTTTRLPRLASRAAVTRPL